MSGHNMQPNDVPDHYQLDLEPDPQPSWHADTPGLTAFDVKELHGRMRDFSNADLKRIAIVPAGTRLEDGEEYVDLMDPQHQPFTARANMVAEFDHYCVPKKMTDYVLWNRLIGVHNEERLDQADEQ